MPLIVEKGSIAIDGISLTVNSVEAETFTVMVIPHTLEHTTLGSRHQGGTINLETDILGKYVARLLGTRSKSTPEGLTLDKLAENGFL
jgi:riboflavin synthase